MASDSQKTMELQTGQKLKVAVLPLSPVRDQCEARPSTVTCSPAKRACTAKTLPVRFWHSRQWQIETRTGSPSQVRCSWPQLQDAMRVVMACPAYPA
jgi:hypothetical protein